MLLRLIDEKSGVVKQDDARMCQDEPEDRRIEDVQPEDDLIALLAAYLGIR